MVSQLYTYRLSGVGILEPNFHRAKAAVLMRLIRANCTVPSKRQMRDNGFALLNPCFGLIMTMTVRNSTGQSAGKYASVNGIKMYYEIHGAGQPLVLIHGGGSTVATTLEKYYR